MLDFPNSPTVGQVFGNYTWDGEKWGQSAGGAILPASNPPLADAASAAIGSSVKYAREDHVHPVFARPVIYAAPFDAMAYSGMQINGSLEVSQELGITATTTANAYVCDGWRHYWSGTMALSSSHVTAAVFPGLPWYINIVVATAQASLGSSDSAQLYQFIEGWRIARLGWGTANAQPVTVGFWSNHHRTGIYSVSLRNSANNRCYATTYTQAGSDVAQYNVITIPGCTDGVWTADNTAGMVFVFAMAAGSGGIASSANTWLAAGYVAAPGQVNAVAATTDQFRFTGIVILPGSEAPSAARSSFVMRPYDQELVTCKRYWQKCPATGSAIAATSTQLDTSLSFPEMRAAPTMTQSGVFTYSNAATSDFTQSSASVTGFSATTPTSVAPRFGNFSGLTASNSYVSRSTSQFLLLDARL